LKENLVSLLIHIGDSRKEETSLLEVEWFTFGQGAASVEGRYAA
jgi:hypothetical protein